ncbi:hypothetical protein [Nitrosomonas sp. HPC101]|uniref:hypothetical protein n=1 Tax=Nitrosomonas sp. HPC101 TaxID=1658667 RepID=UPI001371E806|nr:hypothetical protein [Nitrosomonas sp. HPC101]
MHPATQSAKVSAATGGVHQVMHAFPPHGLSRTGAKTPPRRTGWKNVRRADHHRARGYSLSRRRAPSGLPRHRPESLRAARRGLPRRQQLHHPERGMEDIESIFRAFRQVEAQGIRRMNLNPPICLHNTFIRQKEPLHTRQL